MNAPWRTNAAGQTVQLAAPSGFAVGVDPGLVEEAFRAVHPRGRRFAVQARHVLDDGGQQGVPGGAGQQQSIASSLRQDVQHLESFARVTEWNLYALGPFIVQHSSFVV